MFSIKNCLKILFVIFLICNLGTISAATVQKVQEDTKKLNENNKSESTDVNSLQSEKPRIKSMQILNLQNEIQPQIFDQVINLQSEKPRIK